MVFHLLKSIMYLEATSLVKGMEEPVFQVCRAEMFDCSFQLHFWIVG